MKFSLLDKDLRSRIQKFKDLYDSKLEAKNEPNKKNKPEIKFNHSYDNDLSKTGLGNTLRGTNEVIKNQNKIIKENTMSIQIPIKQIILEFTADHIRDNAGKYAAGTMLGLGAAAGYLAGDPEHGANLLNHSNNDSTNYESKSILHPDNRSDFQKDLAGASQTKTIDYHNDNKGLLGNLSNSTNHFLHNLKSENKFNAMADAQEKYDNLKNSEGELLTAGQMAGLGAAGVAGLGLAAKLRKRK